MPSTIFTLGLRVEIHIGSHKQLSQDCVFTLSFPRPFLSSHRCTAKRELISFFIRKILLDVKIFYFMSYPYKYMDKMVYAISS